ncbi:Ubiquinol oxidase 2, mitochondrial [Capsicum baccatum]|uniref:Ubiquinol oxidase n=1 Tax=Capsicum baccatum TaxID=33114 RepID=A0A2G2WZI6_CAPBA|nr:Ubiquinol oxidase 2, mitochondrial [Capsicum baccatum]
MRGRSFSLNPLEEGCGFHQPRVELPLLKEDIPPKGEGWLCSGCDYKDAAATSREKLDDISGLPSDDSENGLPDIPCPNEVSAKHLGEEISSPENDLVLSGNNFGLARGEGLCSLNGFQNMTHLEYDSECKLYLESNISVQRKKMPETANADKLSELELENACDEQRENATQSDELPLPSNSQTSAALQEIQKTTGSSSTEEKLKVGAYYRDVNHFASPWETYQADLSIDLSKHHVPKKFLDKVAYWSVKLLRIPTDLFFKKRYDCRAMMLETVAGVPGMVGGMLLHLRSLRKFELLRQRIGVCIS